MPTWIAILIGASVGLSTLVYTVMAKRRDRRDEALRREQDQKDAAVQREVARREEEAEWRGEVNGRYSPSPPPPANGPPNAPSRHVAAQRSSLFSYVSHP